MKALDTNIIIRFLINDDKTQGRRVKKVFEEAEESGQPFLLTTPVLLEMIWVLSAVYDFRRDEILHALELLTEMPILEFEEYDQIMQLIYLGRGTKADLSDLLIGLSGKIRGCETTLTFEKGLKQTGLFEQL